MIPDTVDGVRYLPPNLGSNVVADLTIDQGTPLVFSPFFIFGEKYDNGTEDDPNDPSVDQIFQSATIQSTFDGAVVLAGQGSDFAERMSGTRIFSEPISYTQPQPRPGGINAVASTFEMGIGAIFDNLPLGEHTITNVYSSVLGGPFSATYNIRVRLPGDFNDDVSVDAADYVVWCKGLGTIYTQDDYDDWIANFGATVGGGSAALPLSSAVPEPANAPLFLSLAAIRVARSRRRFHRPRFTAAKRVANLEDI